MICLQTEEQNEESNLVLSGKTPDDFNSGESGLKIQVKLQIYSRGRPRAWGEAVLGAVPPRHRALLSRHPPKFQLGILFTFCPDKCCETADVFLLAVGAAYVECTQQHPLTLAADATMATCRSSSLGPPPTPLRLPVGALHSAQPHYQHRCGCLRELPAQPTTAIDTTAAACGSSLPPLPTLMPPPMEAHCPVFLRYLDGHPTYSTGIPAPLFGKQFPTLLSCTLGAAQLPTTMHA
ncbi:hypothetical protein Y1Q_0015591 [Alligator mississippiensis]|uniref:Uncharacterized protein n=1 Tax=Alligator mississippiensis TaxID=8496 RepID=A0A151NNP3_ALLMI|nr:hypothetical protein Y1Q_0015591 [Alligator mississippiensis]